MIQKANKVIADQKTEIDLYSTQVDTLTKENVNLNTELIKTQDQDSAWYHNPWIVGALGFLTGAVTYGLVKK